MIIYENHCCDCEVQSYPCIGNTCPLLNVPTFYCDNCDEDTIAEYEIENRHYCDRCAREYLVDFFNGLTTTEQAKTLNIDIKEIDN